jgi:anti-anti-sigma factor
MSTAEVGWNLEVERGPDWLFVCPNPPEAVDDDVLAEQVWSMLDRHMVYRVVLELNRIEQLSSRFIAQLVKLRKRIIEHGGVMRLCGLNQVGGEALKVSRLQEYLPTYNSRADAVLGPRPSQPR